MSVNLLAPDLRRIFDDLGRRIGILERRVNPVATPAARVVVHTHDGTGADSTAVAGASVTTTPTAAGAATIAIGNAADAGYAESIAIGEGALVDAGGTDPIGAIAFGSGAVADEENAVALGKDTSTTAADQVNLGTKALFAGVPASTSPVYLINSQFTVYLNEAGNALTFVVKYSGGTVKSGTVALT